MLKTILETNYTLETNLKKNNSFFKLEKIKIKLIFKR